MGFDKLWLTWFDEFDRDKLDKNEMDYSLFQVSDPKAKNTKYIHRLDPANVSLKKMEFFI